MSYTRKDLQTLMGIFSQILEGLSEGEFKGLINGEGSLIYQPYPPCHKRSKLPQMETPSKVEKSQVSQELVEELVEELLSIESKEEAFLLLGKKNLKKLVLIEMAGVLNVHLRKSDTKETITQKLIESAVGARLRFKAIKETDVGRKASQE